MNGMDDESNESVYKGFIMSIREKKEFNTHHLPEDSCVQFLLNHNKG